MRILVTGGAGFIGKHLVNRLCYEGHGNGDKVVVIDTKQINGYGGLPPPITYIQGDVSDFEIINQARWRFDSFDRIYHLACHASPQRYQADPVKTSLDCVTGTDLVLRNLRHHFTKVLLTSTSEIYGEPEVHPQPESYRGNVNCLGIRACYDEGKRMAECLMMDYQRQYGVDTRIARIFNTYGPGMDFDDGRVISNFVTQALKGEPLTIYGDGSQTRSFCYVDDMVEGLIRLMEYEGPECHEPHNLGNPDENRIDVIAHAVGWTAEHPLRGERAVQWIKHHELPQDDPTRRCPDITRAKQNLGWEPRVGLSEGLRRTVEDFRSRLCATTSP